MADEPQTCNSQSGMYLNSMAFPSTTFTRYDFTYITTSLQYTTVAHNDVG